jgi:hypothetical protein
MIKPIAIATIILLAAATSALAQGGNPPPAGQPAVIGQTGTMYDGNNANLQLPPEQNAFWAQLWAQPGAQGNPAAVSAVGAGAVGAGAAGASLGTTKTGGEH